MFVRQKRNQSGSISVQVIDKSDGYRVVKTIGTAHDPVDVARLVELCNLFITRRSGQYDPFPEEQHDNAVILDFVQSLGNVGLPISPARAAELTQTMYELTFRLPNTPEDRRQFLAMEPEQSRLYKLFS